MTYTVLGGTLNLDSLTNRQYGQNWAC